MSLAGPISLVGPPACTARQARPVEEWATWAPPLDRVVTFRAGELSLREALDRLAVIARIRVSYSSESLELDRLVCVVFDAVPVGEILSRLLSGAGVQAIAAGGAHVVLAPAQGPFASAQPKPPVVLDRIVVTGSTAGASRKPLPVAIDMVEGDEMGERSDGALTQTFNGSVPGVWMWAQSPSSLLAQYGSIRGTSSFGLSYPKVYIDGIQVANPLVVTRLTPEAVDHIEVIRGPQGAALYGADAISGVTNIVMRQESADAGAPRARLRTGFGLSSSDYASNPSLGQGHVLTLRVGSNTRSASANLEAGATGAYIPGAYQRHFSLNATARSVGAQSLMTGTLRVFAERAGAPASPLLPVSPSQTPVGSASREPQALIQYTAGTTLKVMDNDRLTHSLVAGVDGYSLDGVRDEHGPVPSSADAAILAAQGSAIRGTLRISTVAHVVRTHGVVTDFTLLGEQSLLHQSIVSQRSSSGPVPVAPQEPFGQWRNNTGASAQFNTGILDQVFLTGGLRIERASISDRVATLPMVGASWVLESGVASLKFRGAYGKGVRWPETAARETLWARSSPDITSGGLGPEEQSGTEGGIDFLLGRSVVLQVTRFDQVASGLIQRVMISADTASSSGPGGRRMSYQMQNVGEITNRGWEIQGTLRYGPASLTGTLSLADSRVRQLAGKYTGDLRPGDRMLDVPARTFGVSAAWSGTSWASTITAYRAEDWISYDRLALLQSLTTKDRPSSQVVGPMLRTFWMQYAGVTHLRATLTRRIRQGIAFTVTGDNLLDKQRGEPDNVTVLPGRTITVGLRAEF